jgi:osmoprotectant transport system permease protein
MKTLKLFLLLSGSLPPICLTAQSIQIGAKHFNEGYILGEILAQLLENEGLKVERKFNLGGTAVSFEALRTGAIDLYPEYTGTIAAQILKDPTLSFGQIQDKLETRYRLAISEPYGFDNTYALLVRPDMSRQLGLYTLSDLKAHPRLRTGLSYEFLRREDGWENLSQAYGFSQQASGLEHGLAYQALLENKIDLTDAYSTDGEIVRYGLTLLKDDKHFFPSYQAVTFYRKDLPDKVLRLLSRLHITQTEMQSLNAQALEGKHSHAFIARQFLLSKQLMDAKTPSSKALWMTLGEKTLTHLGLTFLSLLGALLAGLPLGILLYRYPAISRPLLYLSGVLQTIPSIALLALMIPLLGIGVLPAVTALFLYALLPILRNTFTGLYAVEPQHKQVALGMGMTRWQQLRYVELPLAMPAILTGIRTAAVINVGTATLAAFIGAGGLGEFIVTGLALNNTDLILQGAIPAALLAIAVELLFEGLERWLIPAHLRK